MLYELFMIIFHYDEIVRVAIDITNQVIQLISKL